MGFSALPNGLANLHQVSGAVLANANMDDPARTVPDAARWQAQRFVRLLQTVFFGHPKGLQFSWLAINQNCAA